MPTAGQTAPYALYKPKFSVNASGTTITISFAVASRVWTSGSGGLSASGSPQSTSGDVVMSDGLQAGDSYGEWVDLAQNVDIGFVGSVSIGYAVTANSGGQYVSPTNADFVAVATGIPLATLNPDTVPSISQAVFSADFAIPQSPSHLFVALRASGASSSGNYFQSPSTWYPSLRPKPTWYSPNVTISASPARVSEGQTSTLTITTPSWMRDLSASDFDVIGGSLSNFTKVT